MKVVRWIWMGLALTACLKDEPLKCPYTGFAPEPGADWQVTTPEAAEMDAGLLEEAFRLVHTDDRYPMARSLLVMRRGRLVAEAYPHDPADRHRLINIQSCTKSVTSLVVGIAVQQGSFPDLDVPLFDLYPEAFDSDLSKRTITLRHALTMQTGLEFDNSEHTLQLYQHTGNSAQMVLAMPQLHAPGLVTNYNDGAPHLVSKAIEQVAGQPMHDFAESSLFSPLGITDWKWEAAADGTTYGAFSLFLKPRDLAKIGQLLLQNGEWAGERIADSTFLAEATSTQVSLNYNNEPYGYYFWILPAWNAYAARGHGGQFLLVVPEKELVVVYTAWPYTSSALWDRNHELMSLIIASCN